MFVIFSDSMSNIIKSVIFRTAVALKMKATECQKGMMSCVMARQGPQEHAFWFSVGHLSVNPTFSQTVAQDMKIGKDHLSHLVQPAHLQYGNGAQRDEVLSKGQKGMMLQYIDSWTSAHSFLPWKNMLYQAQLQPQVIPPFRFCRRANKLTNTQSSPERSSNV